MSDNPAEGKVFDPRGFARAIPQDKGPAPVHLWDPPFCGDIDMRIASDGVWYYQGSPIQRNAMVRLFSSILKREDDNFFLVTPVEKVGIQVDECPFAAVLVDIQGEGVETTLEFTLNTGEKVLAGSDHRLVFGQNAQGEPRPVLQVRNGLDALLTRNVFYTLVELAAAEMTADSDPDSDDVIAGVYSDGEFFPLGYLPGA